MNNDLIGAVILLAYYLIAVALMPVLLKYWFDIPTEYVRKIHHVGYSLSIFLLLHLFSTWYTAVGAALLLVVLGYPALMLIEKTPFYKRLFVERARSRGELRKQLLYVQLSFGLLIFIFWGLLGTSWHFIAAVAVMAWGFGDAAAALVGKAFGRRKVIHRYIEKAKTIEGTAAMIGAACLALFLTLYFYAGLSWLPSLIIALIAAPFGGVLELFSKKGLDTLTVPLGTSFIILPLVYLFMFLGW